MTYPRSAVSESVAAASSNSRLPSTSWVCSTPAAFSFRRTRLRWETIPITPRQRSANPKPTRTFHSVNADMGTATPSSVASLISSPMVSVTSVAGPRQRASLCGVGELVVTHKQLISEGLLEDRPRAALGECVIGAVDDVHVAAITELPDR